MIEYVFLYCEWMRLLWLSVFDLRVEKQSITSLVVWWLHLIESSHLSEQERKVLEAKSMKGSIDGVEGRM